MKVDGCPRYSIQFGHAQTCVCAGIRQPTAAAATGRENADSFARWQTVGVDGKALGQVNHLVLV